MKKISYLIIVLALSIVSCKDNKKENTTEEHMEVTTAEKFVVKPEATSVKWTAYKTTDKLPVGGEFTVLNFDEKTGASAEEALNNLRFSIPVSSLFTKDPSRDTKLKESFFGAMLDTELINGTIKVTNGNYMASLTMNGVTKDLPLTVEITDARRVSMTGTMNLADWDALGALESLNKVCFDLHTGPDGVSKTWDEVAIEVSTFLRKG
ncbi:YceI family protein [Aestuariibaculum suncheonense]|uniref:YceI family protein n=1 Tax=Aestuariibaculum suncheonense TaxID=1028745 RepID=A0A8J6UAP2_9FLAO|nr:YceI family protein [Aestuariibaculum suncheonense]MBD0834617.1 YceI family protein [Aestuariibaculum suncheonense]